ncbi:MAG: 50S ribosomal protein L23 [Candidatus Marinimicrobia bacterium]|jgi:large subunit ribosomal protein L23|nr:50S ribosomal protein L23 [Candidatus Neomarinimicrobiota bacterium]MDP7037317.1 50S ribosomal protein L23 [Candidatus Neomarinimicrobiota bacterium]
MEFQNIIIKPLFTEKMSILQDTQRKYAFQVIRSANKIEIKDAVQKKFDVEVEKVATMNRKGKMRQMTVRSGGRVIRTSGQKSSWKRAVVTLKEGFSIDLMGGEVSG